MAERLTYGCSRYILGLMAPSIERIRFCTSRDGTRIAYAVSGVGPALVWVQDWVHHIKFDPESALWRPWLALLSRQRTLIRYDFRGCGLSDRHEIEFSHEKHVEDLEAVINASGWERVSIFARQEGARRQFPIRCDTRIAWSGSYFLVPQLAAASPARRAKSC